MQVEVVIEMDKIFCNTSKKSVAYSMSFKIKKTIIMSFVISLYRSMNK